MELFGIVFLTSAMAIVTAVTIRARRALPVRSPYPLEFALPIEEAYSRLHGFVELGQVGAHEWALRDAVENLYIIAELRYLDELNRERKALINFDFGEPIPAVAGQMILSWSCQFLVGTDKSSAAYLQNLINNWVNILLTPQIPVPPSAVPSQFPTLGLSEHSGSLSGSDSSTASTAESDPGTNTDKAEGAATDTASASASVFASTFVDGAGNISGTRTEAEATHNAASISKAWSATRKIQMSPTPQQFDLKLRETFKHMLNRCLQKPSGGYTWKVTDNVEEAYIVADLQFADKISGLKFYANIHFDFIAMEPDQTKVTWSGKFSGLNDKEKGQILIDTWVRNCIEPATPAAISTAEQHLQDGPTYKIVRRTASNWPKDFAYSRLLQKLSANAEISTKWTLKECFKGESIKAKVVHTSTKEPNATCIANVSFGFLVGDRGTVVTWTYHFTEDSDPDVFTGFSQLTDDWLEVILRKN